MKFTKDWLSDHLSTSKSEKQIIEKLNGIGLEVEKVDHAKNENEKIRVEQELILYKKFGLLDVLKFLVYLISTMRENDIVWGVGRGSSVSSYVLYLLGVHKVDSIKYGLDVTDFLKDK